MPPWHHMFDPVRFSTELVYTVIIVLLCFIIYFKTKDMYELTKYKGIQYFRNAFLFFGFAYIVRFLFHMVKLSNITFDLFIPMREIGPFLLVFTTYFSTMAIFYLFYSAIWKKIKTKHFYAVSNVVAIFLALGALFYRTPQ